MVVSGLWVAFLGALHLRFPARRYQHTRGAEVGEERVELLAKIDTGASDCLFEHGYGVALGLRVEEGVHKPMRQPTAGSRPMDTKSRFRFSAPKPRRWPTSLPIRPSHGMCLGGAMARQATRWIGGLRATGLSWRLQSMIRAASRICAS